METGTKQHVFAIYGPHQNVSSLSLLWTYLHVVLVQQSTRSKHTTATTPGLRYKLGGNAADTVIRPNIKRETMSHLRSILDLSALPETLLLPGKTGETFLLLVAPERRHGQPCLRLFFLSSSS